MTDYSQNGEQAHILKALGLKLDLATERGRLVYRNMENLILELA